MTTPIQLSLKQKPTILNRADAMNDAVSQEIRHRWPMERSDEIVAIAYVLRGWSLCIDATLNEDQKKHVERKAKDFAHAYEHSADPENQAVDVNGQTVDRVKAPGD